MTARKRIVILDNDRLRGYNRGRAQTTILDELSEKECAVAPAGGEVEMDSATPRMQGALRRGRTEIQIRRARYRQVFLPRRLERPGW